MIHSIPKTELNSRQQKILQLLPKNQALLILSNQVFLRNSDTDYRFRQDSNFWYFTGFDEDKAAILFLDGKIYLFAKEKHDFSETWTGKITGLDAAKSLVNADEVYPFEKLLETIQNKAAKFKKIFFDADGNSFVKLRSQLEDLFVDQQIKVEPEEYLTSQLRMYKSTWEIEQMQNAAQISILAHQRIAQYLQDYKSNTTRNPLFNTNSEKNSLSEYQLHAILDYTFKENACLEAYPPIVASGDNATTLHYWQNNKNFKSNDLILIDAACEHNYYSSDITRVYSLNKFSSAQQEIYDLVLKTNLEVIEFAKTHTHKDLTLQRLQQLSNQILSQGLIDLSILKGSLEHILKKSLFRSFYMHGISHWLGLDTHDQGVYKDNNGNPVVLKPGMSFTVEPGLYFKADDLNVPEKYRGIGVRIEDDLVLTKDGIINLTGSLIK
ncbi:MAG: aminopeptidase P N-terminal domain-containing protein [bacterium]